MSNSDVINNTIVDLKAGYDLALVIGNDFLKDYAMNRLKEVKDNKDIYNYVSTITLVNSYLVDLALFINISNIVDNTDSKNYFRGRLISIVNLYPELRNRSDLVNLI